jgi:competence protein ComEA
MRRAMLSLSLLLCFSAAVWASADANTASEAELDGVRGLGPSTTARILAARDSGMFRDWKDFMQRVKGIKPATARKLSEGGLTVNQISFENALSGAAGQ